LDPGELWKRQPDILISFGPDAHMSPRRALAKAAGFMDGLTADATRSSRIAMTASSARDVQAARVTSERVK
jgi:hypothetical protein